jgi:hypothetical protein
MDIDILLFVSALILTAASSMGMVYYIYRNGVAIQINMVVVSSTIGAVSSGFVLGKLGFTMWGIGLAGAIVLLLGFVPVM